MGNNATRNITSIIKTKATAELQEEVMEELESKAPEVSMANLLNVTGDGDEEKKSEQTKELRDQSGQGLPE